MASSSNRNATHTKECAILSALNNKQSCENIDLNWFDYQFKLTIVDRANTSPFKTIGFYLSESQADHILRETSGDPSQPFQARHLSRGSTCSVEALDLKTCKNYEVTVMKNHKDEFILNWREVRQAAKLKKGQEIAFGVYNIHWITNADGKQHRAYGVFFTTM